MRRSPEVMAVVIEAVASGCTFAEAMERVDCSESAYWNWKRASMIAERDFDFGDFYFPHGGVTDFFHCHIERAIKSRIQPVSGESPFPRPLSAMEKELLEKAPKPMTDLERDLRQRLAIGVKNPKPNMPVHVEHDQPDDAKRERINSPSDQAGLPTRLPEQPMASAPDYSRRALPRSRVQPLDSAGIGSKNRPPPGGFRVA